VNAEAGLNEDRKYRTEYVLRTLDVAKTPGVLGLGPGREIDRITS
jgi:hypothetical protein